MSTRTAQIDYEGLVFDIRWEAPHTVNSYIHGHPVGCVSIGDYAEDSATEKDWAELLDELEEAPDTHPLING